MKRSTFALAILLALFLSVETTHAQAFITSGIPGCDFETGELQARCARNFLAHLIQTLFSFTGGICIVMIIISGYQIVLGNLPGGSSEAGKNRLTWAVIGFIMSATAFFIMDFVIAAIGA